MAEIDLSGTWRAARADPERRRRFSDPDLDDDADPDWHDLVVPGHWRSHPAFADADGPLLHRCRFATDPAAPRDRFGGDSAHVPGRFGGDSAHPPDRFGGDSADAKSRGFVALGATNPRDFGDRTRWWLVLDGVFYQGDVWLDGHYVGDTEGYFFPHQFEVTDQLATGTEHLLAIEVTCSPQTDLTHKRNLTGSLQHSAWLDPAYDPGGIWRPVRIESTGPLRIRHTRVRCLRADPDQAVLALRAVVDAVAPTSATLRTTISPTTISPTPAPGAAAPTGPAARDHELHHVLAAGENRIEWTVTVDRPRLWWPHALGDQPTYDIDIAVFVDPRGLDRSDAGAADTDTTGALTPSDHRHIRTGLRTVRLDRWSMYVNDERLFLKGTNLVPTRQALAEATPAEIAADVASAKDLGLDLVRVHSHIARPELYRAADEAGMLVWQDLPLQWGYARSVRRQALRQAREAVDLLSHHPSLALWCTHSEPVAGGLDPGEDGAGRRREQARRRIGNALPTWNRSLLGRSIRRTLRTTDGTRPVVSGSGMLPHLPAFDGTATHLWYGWEYGAIDDLALAAARWPNLVRFVAELGAASVPDTAHFAQPDRWPHLDWERLRTRHGLRRDLLDPVADPADFATFDAWRAATQAHQAQLLRRQIEALRRLKYRPTGGFALFFLADGHPAVSHSLLDHRRVPKAAYQAVRDACRPVIVVADPAGNGSTLALHVVSDRRKPLTKVTVQARVGGEHRRWVGDVATDSVAYIATIDTPPAGTSIELSVIDADGTELAANRYLLT